MAFFHRVGICFQCFVIKYYIPTEQVFFTVMVSYERIFLNEMLHGWDFWCSTAITWIAVEVRSKVPTVKHPHLRKSSRHNSDSIAIGKSGSSNSTNTGNSSCTSTRTITHVVKRDESDLDIIQEQIDTIHQLLQWAHARGAVDLNRIHERFECSHFNHHQPHTSSIES